MIQPHPERQAALDSRSAIFAGAYISGLNVLIVNLQPLILGALADSHGFTDRQLGQLGAIFVAFATVCSLSGPLWVRRVDWRAFSRSMIALAVLALVGGAFLKSGTAVFALFAVLGVIKAALGIPAFASLGDGSNPDRNYGVSVGFQALLAAAVTAPSAAYIIPRFGVPGLFITIAVLVASGWVVSRWLPRRGIATAEVERLEGPRAGGAAIVAPVVALVALALFTGAILGFWYFIERIGVDRGVPAGTIGLALSAISLASIATASIVAWLGGRFPSLVFVGVGTLLLVAGFSAMKVEGTAAYVAGTMAFAMGWGLAQPAYYALVRKVDATGRLFVAAPAAGGVAGVAIGLVAGPLIEGGGYSGLVVACAGLALAAAATGTAARVVARRLSRVSGIESGPAAGGA